MLRKCAFGFVALLVCVGFVLGAEATGKLKSVEKGKVVVTIDGKDKSFKMSKETKLIKGSDEVKGKEKGKLLKDAIGGDVTIVYDKDTISELKVK